MVWAFRSAHGVVGWATAAPRQSSGRELGATSQEASRHWEGENEVKAKAVETTISATIPSPIALILPKIGRYFLPELKPGLVFEREGDQTTAGFKVDLAKKKIIDPLDATGTRTKTLFTVNLKLQGSQHTSIDPEKGQANTKFRGTVTVSFR